MWLSRSIKEWGLLPLVAVGTLLCAIPTLLTVALMDVILKGEVSVDYLLTGIVTVTLIAPPTLLLLGRLLQQVAQQHQDALALNLDRADACLRAALDTIDEGIAMITPDGEVLTINQRLIELWGLPPEVVGARRQFVLTDHVRPQLHDPDAFQSLLERLSQPGQDTNQTLRLKDGRLFSFHARALTVEHQWGHLCCFQDITERQRLIEIDYQRALLDHFPFMVWIKDAQSRFQAVNRIFSDNVGWPSPQALIGKTDLDIWPLDLAESYRADDRAVLASGRAITVEEPIEVAGARRWYETYKSPVAIEGRVIGIVGYARDITDRKQAEARLHLAASVFTYAREGIMITRSNGEILDVNEAFTEITGYRRDEMLGRNPRLLASGRHDRAFFAALWRALTEHGHWSGEIWNRRRNGEIFATLQAIGAVRDGDGSSRQYVALMTDITALKEHEHQLEHIAHYDILTRLPNRVLFADRLHQAMVQAARRNQPLAVAYLDLDGFKSVNDRQGHDAGDRLLKIVAERMQDALREGDTLARVGGDEFVAVLIDLSDREACRPLLVRLLAAANLPVVLDDQVVLRVSASIGVTFYPQAEATEALGADQLLRQADQAMYQAKLTGKNRYHLFDADLDRGARGHHKSIEDIRRALAAGEFTLHYQPKVNMRTGAPIGAEALIRWQYPGRGLLLPERFLPMIEDHALSIELGDWVIETVLTQIGVWRAQGLDITVSVNIGARQLQHPDFTACLGRRLAAHPDIPPGQLQLEVLETSALEDLAQVSQVIDRCRTLGVTFAMDDFGTGYSSLTYLKRLPVEQLKIDWSFVRDMLDDPEDLVIVESVLGLALAFRREVLAEGVESLEHGEMLLRLGCDLGQGYGIARPMPAEALPDWWTTWHAPDTWGDLPVMTRDTLPLLRVGVEHRAWIRSVCAHLNGDGEALPPLDHHQCHLGQWLHDAGAAVHGARPAFQAADALHQQMHALAAELVELQRQGRGAEALARLGELHTLRDALLARLRELMAE